MTVQHRWDVLYEWRRGSNFEVTEGLEVKMGLHQGSALCPCSFAVEMYWMTDAIREEAATWTTFADAIVICSESNEQVEEKLESWIYAWERRGMKGNMSKTEYMCVNGRQHNCTLRMREEYVATLDDFIYLGSTVQRRCMDAVREDAAVVEVTEEDAESRTKWMDKWLWRPLKPKVEEDNLIMAAPSVMWRKSWLLCERGV